MGGTGAGHKSERARRSRLVNIQKARAARKRAPLPWRSGVESRIIEQLVWQWWVEKSSGQWLVALRSSGQASGQKNQQQVPHTATMRPVPFAKALSTGRNDRLGPAFGGVRVERDSASRAGAASSAPTKAKRPWAKYRVARFLGVSHTWVNKLVKRIEADPERMRRKMRAFAPATFEKLERAREETRRERERGWVRGPIRWRRVKVTIQGRRQRVAAVTRASRLRQGYGEASGQAAPVRYSELPTWAIGLPLPGGSGIAALPLSGQAGQGLGMRTLAAGKPRPVPFAFRRRR